MRITGSGSSCPRQTWTSRRARSPCSRKTASLCPRTLLSSSAVRAPPHMSRALVSVPSDPWRNPAVGCAGHRHRRPSPVAVAPQGHRRLQGQIRYSIPAERAKRPLPPFPSSDWLFLLDVSDVCGAPVESVIIRIFYSLDRGRTGKIQLRQFRESFLPLTRQQIGV